MCMTKREKALARFYGEIKEKITDPARGLAAMKDIKKWAEENTEATVLKKKKEGEKEAQTYTKKVPKYSVATIKEKARKQYPELAKVKKTKEEEVLEYFQKKLDEQKGQKVEA